MYMNNFKDPSMKSMGNFMYYNEQNELPNGIFENIETIPIP
jgi:hypothetical protein